MKSEVTERPAVGSSDWLDADMASSHAIKTTFLKDHLFAVNLDDLVALNLLLQSGAMTLTVFFWFVLRYLIIKIPGRLVVHFCDQNIALKPPGASHQICELIVGEICAILIFGREALFNLVIGGKDHSADALDVRPRPCANNLLLSGP